MPENTSTNSPAQEVPSTVKCGSPAIATVPQSASSLVSTSHQKKNVSLKSNMIAKQKSTAVVQSLPSRAASSSASPSAQNRLNDGKTMHSTFSLEADDTTGLWLCLECDVCLTSYQDVRLHLTGTHKELFDPALCEHCGWRSGNDREKHFHMYTNHQINSPLYTFAECDLCNRKYSSQDELEAHMKECLNLQIVKSEEDPEDDGSITYHIILGTDDDDRDNMPTQQSFTPRKLVHGDDNVDLAEDGHRENSRLQRADGRSGVAPHCSTRQGSAPSRASYLPPSPEYNEENVWTVTNVSEILKESGDDGRLLRSRIHKKNLTRPQRTKLCKMIVDYFISKKINMTLQLSYALERDVVRLFPGEKLDDWRGNGRSSGTLYNSFRYRRRAIQTAELKEIQKKSAPKEGEKTL